MTVRQEHAGGWGSVLHYGQKVAAARQKFDAAREGSVTRRIMGTGVKGTGAWV